MRSRVVVRSALLGALLAAPLTAGVVTVSTLGCRYHEAREGPPLQPDGRVQASGHAAAALAAGRTQDAVFDPAATDWRVVSRVRSDAPTGTVLKVSSCAPLAPWARWPARMYYLTVAR